MSSIPAEVVTRRLVLRPITEEDLPGIRSLWTDADVRRHVGGPVPGRREARSVNRAGHFCVVRRGDLVVVGVALAEERVGGDLELSCFLLPQHWGSGYGGEVFAALAQLLPSTYACTSVHNHRAQRALERGGMKAVRRFVAQGAEQVRYEPAEAAPHRCGDSCGRGAHADEADRSCRR